MTGCLKEKDHFIRCREGEEALYVGDKGGDTDRTLARAALETFCQENCEHGCRRQKMTGKGIEAEVRQRLLNAAGIIGTEDSRQPKSYHHLN